MEWQHKSLKNEVWPAVIETILRRPVIEPYIFESKQQYGFVEGSTIDSYRGKLR